MQNCSNYFKKLEYDVSPLEGFPHELVCLPNGFNKTLL
jgi:hypothetical protein